MMFSGINYHKNKSIGMELASERSKVKVCMAIVKEAL